jgi:hypothetical protein
LTGYTETTYKLLSTTHVHLRPVVLISMGKTKGRPHQQTARVANVFPTIASRCIANIGVKPHVRTSRQISKLKLPAPAQESIDSCCGCRAGAGHTWVMQTRIHPNHPKLPNIPLALAEGCNMLDIHVSQLQMMSAAVQFSRVRFSSVDSAESHSERTRLTAAGCRFS